MHAKTYAYLIFLSNVDERPDQDRVHLARDPVKRRSESYILRARDQKNVRCPETVQTIAKVDAGCHTFVIEGLHTKRFENVSKEMLISII